MFATIEGRINSAGCGDEDEVATYVCATRTGNGLEGLPFHVWGTRHGLGIDRNGPPRGSAGSSVEGEHDQISDSQETRLHRERPGKVDGRINQGFSVYVWCVFLIPG